MTKIQKTTTLGGTIFSALVLSASPAFANTGFGEVKTGTGWIPDLGSLITSALSIVMVIALLMVLLYLILGGIAWITSGGDKGKTEEARNKITAAVIGIIILAAAWAIVTFVSYLLGFDGGIGGAIKTLKPIGTE